MFVALTPLTRVIVRLCPIHLMNADSVSGGHQSEMEMGLRVTDFGRVGSWVSMSDLVFDPVLSFNMHIHSYRLREEMYGI